MISTTLPGTDKFRYDVPDPGANNIVYAYTSGKYYYPEHKTPYLFVTNYLNKGNYLLNGKHIQISDRFFYFLNINDGFEIKFGKALPVQTLLIQFNSQFFESGMNCILSSAERLLELPEVNTDSDFHIPSVPFSLKKNIQNKINSVLKNKMSNEHVETVLFEIISEFAILNAGTAKQLNKIQAVKKSTKVELYRRLFLAKEFINDNIFENLTLEQIAREACLNKFHFLSSFKNLFNITPYQYIVELKLQKAFELLESGHSVSETCIAVGFDSLGSFSNTFKKRFLISPSAVLKHL